MKRALVALVIPLLAFTACGGDGEKSADKKTQTSAPASPSPSMNASYGTLEDLRDAAVAAGYACPSWEADNAVEKAAESGHCSVGDVFATFATPGDLQAQLEMTRDFANEFDMDPEPTLVGPNWTINTADPEALQKALGGTVSR